MGYFVESAHSGHNKHVSGVHKSFEACRGAGGWEYFGKTGGEGNGG